MQLLAEGAESGLDLVEARGMTQIQETVDLGRMPTEPASELGFTDTDVPHGLVKGDLRNA
jgi:hypothetical protein